MFFFISPQNKDHPYPYTKTAARTQRRSPMGGAEGLSLIFKYPLTLKPHSIALISSAAAKFRRSLGAPHRYVQASAPFFFPRYHLSLSSISRASSGHSPFRCATVSPLSLSPPAAVSFFPIPPSPTPVRTMQTLPSADCFPPPPPAKLLFHSKMASALEPLLSGCIFQACCCVCFERVLTHSPRPLDPKFR